MGGLATTGDNVGGEEIIGMVVGRSVLGFIVVVVVTLEGAGETLTTGGELLLLLSLRGGVLLFLR